MPNFKDSKRFLKRCFFILYKIINFFMFRELLIFEIAFLFSNYIKLSTTIWCNASDCGWKPGASNPYPMMFIRFRLKRYHIFTFSMEIWFTTSDAVGFRLKRAKNIRKKMHSECRNSQNFGILCRILPIILVCSVGFTLGLRVVNFGILCRILPIILVYIVGFTLGLRDFFSY